MDKMNTKTAFDVDYQENQKLYEGVFPGTITVSETKNGAVTEKEYTSLKAALADAATKYDTYEYNGTVYSNMTVINKMIKIVGNDDLKDYDLDFFFPGNFAVQPDSGYDISGFNAKYIFDGRAGSTLILYPYSRIKISDSVCHVAIYNYDVIMAGFNDLIINDSTSSENDLNGGNGALAKITATATSEITINRNKGYGLKGGLNLAGPIETSPVFSNRNTVTMINNSDIDLTFDVSNDDGIYSFAASDVTASSVKIEGASSITIETDDSSFKVGDKVLFDTSVSGAVTIDSNDINK